jgi:branched-subunit amino acid aminotransferase/4-amino-4-deoxychorismate lyase
MSSLSVEHVLGLARNAGLGIRREPISPRDVAEADEMFITSSTREVMPVARVGGQMVGNGKPGPITRLLHKGYLKSTASFDSVNQ